MFYRDVAIESILQSYQTNASPVFLDLDLGYLDMNLGVLYHSLIQNTDFQLESSSF